MLVVFLEQVKPGSESFFEIRIRYKITLAMQMSSTYPNRKGITITSVVCMTRDMRVF